MQFVEGMPPRGGGRHKAVPDVTEWSVCRETIVALEYYSGPQIHRDEVELEAWKDGILSLFHERYPSEAWKFEDVLATKHQSVFPFAEGLQLYNALKTRVSNWRKAHARAEKKKMVAAGGPAGGTEVGLLYVLELYAVA